MPILADILCKDMIKIGNYNELEVVKKVDFGFYLDGEYTRGYITSQYTTKDKKSDYKPDNNFEDYLTAQDFPESYKESLRQLHEKYPLWVFVADHNGRDWDTMHRML